MGKRLVRDRALEHWVVPGAEKQVRAVHDADEHRTLLAAKLLEECGEVVMELLTSGATADDLAKEIGDALSVLESVARTNGLDWDDVLRLQRRRDDRYGSFTAGLVWQTSR